MVSRPWSSVFLKCLPIAEYVGWCGRHTLLCITQITVNFIIVHNALFANYGWFWLAHLEVLTNFATLEHGLKSVIDTRKTIYLISFFLHAYFPFDRLVRYILS